MLYGVSTFAILLIALGWKFRHRAMWHMTCMSLAFCVDLALLLYIEFNRHALAHVKHCLLSAQSDYLLYFHVTVSVITLILYLVQIGSGIKLFWGGELTRQFHQRAGLLFVACRLLNYGTSFFIQPS